MATKYLGNSETIDIDNNTITNSNPLSSEVQVKTSLASHIPKSWLPITLGLIAIAGIVVSVGVTVVTLAVLRQTTTTSTTISTTTSVTTTTARICLTIPSPRPSDVWYMVDNLTTPRIYHTSTYISQDNSVLIAGGITPSVTLISTDKYIPSTGCFQNGITMPRPRAYHTADILPAFSDYILFSGGLGPTGIINTSDLVNPLNGNSITIPLTSSRHSHKSALFGSSKLVLVGGIGIVPAPSRLNTGDAMFSGSISTFTSVTNNLTIARVDHTVTRLGNNSGIVLIVGGQYLTTSELYYGASNIFVSLGSGGTMPAARAYHTATYLPSFDTVLITGGCYNGWGHLNTMILFDVPTLSFTTLTTTMSAKRSWHTATLLPNGKVLIVGGTSENGVTASADLIDPANNYLVTPASNISIPRYHHTATLIPDNNDGTVLICGGYNGTVYFNTCELYLV